MPAGFSDLEKKLLLVNQRTANGTGRLIQAPYLDTLKLGHLDNEISEVRLKSSVIISYLPTAYVIEVSTTRTWKGVRTSSQPEIGWGIEVYAVHWDESINYAGTGERRKDWGEELSIMWPEPESSSLKERFRKFMRHVLEIQALLEGVSSS